MVIKCSHTDCKFCRGNRCTLSNVEIGEDGNCQNYEPRVLETKNCRVCKYFVRVYEEKLNDNIRKRGFCVYGCGEGDFSLYVYSNAMDCPYFELSEESLKIYELEEQLRKKWLKTRGRYWDGRTKVGRLILKRHMEKYWDKPMGYLLAEREVLEELYQEFVKKHSNEMEHLKNSCKMTLNEYKALISSMIRKAMLVVSKLEVTRLENSENDVEYIEDFKNKEGGVNGGWCG